MNVDEVITDRMGTVCLENVINAGRFINDVVQSKGDISTLTMTSPDYLLLCEKCDGIFPVSTSSMLGPILYTDNESVLSTVHSMILSRSNGRRNEESDTDVLMFDVYGFFGCMQEIHDLFTIGEGSIWLNEESEIYREHIHEFLDSMRTCREYVDREVSRIDLSKSLSDDLESLMSNF